MARIEKVRPHYAGDNEAFIAAVEHELVQIANEIEAARRAGDVVRRKILNRLIEACRTDEICKTSDEGPRRYDPLSGGGLGFLTRHGLWPTAMREVAALGTAHPNARKRFLETYVKVPWGSIQARVDEDVWFAALRVAPAI